MLWKIHLWRLENRFYNSCSWCRCFLCLHHPGVYVRTFLWWQSLESCYTGCSLTPHYLHQYNHHWSKTENQPVTWLEWWYFFLKKTTTTAMFLPGFVVGFQRCLTTAAPAQRKRVMTWDMGTGKKSRGGFAAQERGWGATFSGLLVGFEITTICE